MGAEVFTRILESQSDEEDQDGQKIQREALGVVLDVSVVVIEKRGDEGDRHAHPCSPNKKFPAPCPERRNDERTRRQQRYTEAAQTAVFEQSSTCEIDMVPLYEHVIRVEKKIGGVEDSELVDTLPQKISGSAESSIVHQLVSAAEGVEAVIIETEIKGDAETNGGYMNFRATPFESTTVDFRVDYRKFAGSAEPVGFTGLTARLILNTHW